MELIRTSIAHVVDEVHDARQHAEDRKGPKRVSEGIRIAQLFAEDQAGKDDDVLRPLFRPKREQQIGQQRPIAWFDSSHEHGEPGPAVLFI